MRRALLLSPLCLALLAALPAAGAQSRDAYVVRAEGNRVFLDIGTSGGLSAGEEFALCAEGDELKHPVSGESLGREKLELGLARVESVEEKYSVLVATFPLPVAPGRKVCLRARALSPAAQPAAAEHTPALRSPALPYAALDLAFGDLDGDGAAELVLALPKGAVALPWPPGASWPAVGEFRDQATDARALSVDAADLDGDGKAEVFLSVHNRFFGRVETYVLALLEGRLERRESLPWLTRSFQEADGRASLASQQLLDDPTFPFGRIERLAWRDGRYVREGPPLSHSRLEWLYGFGLAEHPEYGPVSITHGSSGRLRLQLGKDAWHSDEAYGQTPNRLRWRGRLLHCHPRLILRRGPKGLERLYALRNIPRLGALSETLALYARSRLQALRVSTLAPELEWAAPMEGSALGLASLPDGRLAVLLTGPGERSAVLAFEP